MTPAHRRGGKRAAAALITVALTFPLAWAAFGGSSADARERHWKLRARLKRAPSASWGASRTIPRVLAGAADAACRHARSLGDGRPDSARVAVRMLRRRGDGRLGPVGSPGARCVQRASR
jgi:hypothetical protein